MAVSPLRYKRLIHELPKHKHAKDAIMAAGFSESTAKHEAKKVLQSALKYQAREILETVDETKTNSKQLMNEILGISSIDLFNLLRKIANQDKDYGSALKVLAPLVKEHGIILNTDDEKQNVTVPILNIVVDNTAKNIESELEHEKLDTPNVRDGSVEPD